MEEIEVGGAIRDLRHLGRMVVPIVGKGMNGGDLRVSVSFSIHAVSESCAMGQHDMMDENGKPRRFCEDRYAFSLGLPELARRMISQKYFCWKSSDRNRRMNFAVIDVAPGRVRELADGRHQVVFFYLYPASGEDADVNLVITSCHARDIVFSRIRRRFDVHMLLRKCLYEQKRIP